MSDKCPTCGSDLPDAPLAWLLRQCEAQTARLRTRASRVCAVVRAGRPRMRVDESLERWTAATEALRKLMEPTNEQLH